MNVQIIMDENSSISWLDHSDQPTTVLHREIQRRISEFKLKRECQQQTLKLLFKAMELYATRQLSEFHKIMPVKELFPMRHESTFDLWQQEVMKYLKMLQK